LQGAAPGKQGAPNPTEEVREDAFGAFRLTSAGPDAPSLLGPPHHLLAALLMKKKEEIR